MQHHLYSEAERSNHASTVIEALYAQYKAFISVEGSFERSASRTFCTS